LEAKKQLISRIEQEIPYSLKNGEEFKYIEPFVGGGAILFWILQRYKNITHAIINDINKDLIDTYTTIKYNPSELILELKKIQDDYLKLTENARKEFFLENRELFNKKIENRVLNSALFIFLNKTCFNGLYRVNSKGLFNAAFGKYTNPKICDERTIVDDCELLQNVEIIHGDFYDTLQYASNNSFYYIDPPYRPLSTTSSFNLYAKEAFNDGEQIRLKNFCLELNNRSANFCLSNSDPKNTDTNDNFFDDLYSAFEIKRVYANRTVNTDSSKRGKLSEIIVTN